MGKTYTYPCPMEGCSTIFSVMDDDGSMSKEAIVGALLDKANDHMKTAHQSEMAAMAPEDMEKMKKDSMAICSDSVDKQMM